MIPYQMKEDEITLWEEHFIATKLIKITTRHMTSHELTMNDMYQNQPKYYMDMLKNHVATNQEVTIDPTNLVVDIRGGNRNQ